MAILKLKNSTCIIHGNSKALHRKLSFHSKFSRMDFYGRPPRFSLSSSSSFGDFIGKVKVFCSFAVSAIIGNVFSAVLTFFFALVGTLLGAMTGALIGQETESGFVRGAAVGAISGAVFSIEVLVAAVPAAQGNKLRNWRIEVRSVEQKILIPTIPSTQFSNAWNNRKSHRRRRSRLLAVQGNEKKSTFNSKNSELKVTFNAKPTLKTSTRRRT